jgi:hypothetical protein
MLAAGLSLTCFLGTSIWYYSTDSLRQSQGEKKPVAYIERTKDEIHRRPVTRIIWQLINNGEPIYPGEAIRTSAAGEVRIQFAESTRYIDVESDSLIIISQNQGQEISLDLMDGSLMVHQGAGGDQGPGLSLNSGDAKVDLSKATASLSKNNGNLDLQVLKGQVKVDSKGQQTEIGSGKSGAFGAQGLTFRPENLQILSPGLEQSVSLNPDSPQPVTFQWKGFPEKARVSFLLGSSRKNLKNKIETLENRTSLPLTAGIYFWKLVAKDPVSEKAVAESPIYRIEVVNRYAPVVLSPTVDERILNDELGVDFHWIRPEQCLNVLLEVSKDAQMTDLMLTQNLDKGDRFQQKFLDGEYYFRLSAQYPGSSQLIKGKIQKFHLSKDPVGKLAQISWDEKMNSSGQLSVQHYAERPMAHLKWTAPVPAIAARYRVKVAQSEEDLSVSPKVVETKEVESQTVLDKPGRYLAVVEALNEKNQVIALSPIQNIDVTPFPLLQAPQLLPLEGDLHATPQGRLDLRWNPIEGAKGYEVTLLDGEGKPIRTGRFPKNSTSLVNLLPGDLKVQVSAIDSYGRVGEKPPPRPVRVPASSGLSIPKLKKLKVN